MPRNRVCRDRRKFELLKFLAENWTYLVSFSAAIAVVVGWILTLVGWTRVHQNNLIVETKKFESALELEREKFRTSLSLDKKRAELKYVSDQIQLLYGPLFSLGSASEMAFHAFMNRHANGRNYYFDGEERTPEELAIWRIWMRTVMMPLNLKMEQAIIEHSHLIDGPTMPHSFQLFLSHTATYKAVLQKWEEANKDGLLDSLTSNDHVSIMNFPAKMHLEVSKTFTRLRNRQRRLLSTTEGQSTNPDEREAIRS